MYLSEVTDRLYQGGWKQEEVELVRIELFEDYPEIEEEAFSQSMSTIPVDPEVPDEWVKRVFDEASKGQPSISRVYLNNPYGNIPDSDRDAIVRKVKELLPDPSTISDPKERKSIENRIKRAEDKIRNEKSVGLSISADNTKLGKVTNFSLPAGNNFRIGACPGATETCEELCYAKGALFQMNEWRYFVNWAYVQLYPDRFIEAFDEVEMSQVVRVHAGGDFYSTEYIDLWIEIARRHPKTRFYAYTRSWQDGTGKLQEEFIDALDRLSKVENWRLILSLDHDTGMPPKDVVPLAFRAWLATEDSDLPPSKVGLIFRDHDGMDSVAPMMGGAPVCPVERSADYTKASGKITCQNCGFCWSTGHLLYNLRPDDPSQFDKYAKVDVAARTAVMFRGVGKESSVVQTNPAVKYGKGTEIEDCSCEETCDCDPCPCDECEKCSYDLCCCQCSEDDDDEGEDQDEGEEE